jgi:hypothetical protein
LVQIMGQHEYADKVMAKAIAAGFVQYDDDGVEGGDAQADAEACEGQDGAGGDAAPGRRHRGLHLLRREQLRFRLLLLLELLEKFAKVRMCCGRVLNRG